MVDLNGPEQMPGDFTAIDSSSKRTAMESYGAGSVEARSSSERLNLKPGATATVTIPVDATQLTGKPALPASVPFLFYNESSGIWKQDGTAQLTGSGTNAAYVATTRHFSTLNSDIFKSGESCVAVEVVPGAFPLYVEVNLQPSKPNPTAVQVRTLKILGSGDHSVICNLPNDMDIALTPIIYGLKFDGSTGDIPAGIFIVNTGGPQLSPTAPPPPAPDGTYNQILNGTLLGPCRNRVTLTNQIIKSSCSPLATCEFLQDLHFEASNIDEFKLSDLTFAGEIVQGAKDYYKQADPLSKRPSLDTFKQVNRFGQPQNPPDGEVEYSTFYANGGDLGFGREMHCRRNLPADIPPPPPKTFDLACYVTNYDQPPNNVADQVAAEDANKGPNALHVDATVAMEYSRMEQPSAAPKEFPDGDHARAVKFYAYDTKTGTQLFQASLDGHGARPFPNLCVVCHGGKSADTSKDPNDETKGKKPAYTQRSDVIDQNSKFLPFDLHFFKFPLARGRQEASFKSLNIDIVKQVATQINPADPIAELIDAWYANNAATQKDDAVIAGWDTGGAGNPNHRDNHMYRDVFAHACRTCHVAQPYKGPSFTTVADFRSRIDTVQGLVCNQKVMPHAQRTNDIFWTSLAPNMPGFLEIWGQSLDEANPPHPDPKWSTLAENQCGTLQGGPVVTSFFEGTVLPILQVGNGNCVTSFCHDQLRTGGGHGQANWHVSDKTTTYNELLNLVPGENHHTIRTGPNELYVTPSHPDTSLLYLKVTGTTQGQQMPPTGNGPDLNQHQTNGHGIDAVEINTWITSGAFGP